MSIATQLELLNKEITPYHASLVAVSKNHPIEAIQEAYACGQRLFGENKVQEMMDKKSASTMNIDWHLIGHLQTNKIKYIIGETVLIHAVDSVKLLHEINKQSAKSGIITRILLQLHVAKEETKFGFSVAEFEEFASKHTNETFPHIQFAGIMGMATNTNEKLVIKSEFKLLKASFEQAKQHELGNALTWNTLSMGMSSDYKIALDEGSTLVRIGSTIFGNRIY
jgi:pyridoxal phosphate enzyme (YggS family)